jgi:hypothetical protein
MPTLSKSKIIAYRQCPKRLWLEVHRPELREDSDATKASFQVGHQVGDVARKIYDPAATGVCIDITTEGFKAAFERSARLIEAGDRPIFEAGFKALNTIALADVMIPSTAEGSVSWKMIEVKSSTSVKDYHRDDVAVQAFLARAMGVPVASVSVACIDSSWVYPGSGDYRGLLAEHDLTEETSARADEVSGWISGAHEIAAATSEPEIETGPHCHTPFECGFCGYCNREKALPQYPVDWLPRLSPKLRRTFKDLGVEDLRDIPENLLHPKQRLVRHHTLTDTVFFNREGAMNALHRFGSPAYFLDFETCNMPVPIWAGTRPYQQIPFQFSLHKLGASLEHTGFLDISGEDPSRRFSEAVVDACGANGPVFVYNAKFEKMILRQQAAKFPDLAKKLEGIVARVVDLLPIAEKCYYHPDQRGSWSIKRILPAVVPELSYADLAGIKDGGMAVSGYTEAIHPDTPPERKEEIRTQLLAYCHLDTLAMVGLWKVFSGMDQPQQE